MTKRIRWGGLLLVLMSSRALAHDLPRGTGVFQQGSRLLVRSTRGLLTGVERTGDFRLLCNEALGIETYEVPSIVPRADGRWLIGTSHGLLLASADLCSLDPLPPLGTTPIGALAQDPSDSDVIYATTANAAASNGLYESRDNGLHFAAYGDQTHDEFFSQLRLSASDAQRLCASGRKPSASAPSGFAAVFAHSEDRGLHFAVRDIALGPNEYGFELFGTTLPEPADVLGVVHAYLGIAANDRLVVSHDTGQSWVDALSAPAIAAFAQRAVDHTLWLGAASGLWRSTDGASTLTQVGARPVSCLAAVASQLYVCEASGASAGLSVSDDDGVTLRRVMSFADVVGMLACPSTANVTRMCQSAWSDWQRELMPAMSSDAGAADSGKILTDADDGGPEPAALRARDSGVDQVQNDAAGPGLSPDMPMLDAGSQSSPSGAAAAPDDIARRQADPLRQAHAQDAGGVDAGVVDASHNAHAAAAAHAQGCTCSTPAGRSRALPPRAAPSLPACLLLWAWLRRRHRGRARTPLVRRAVAAAP
jgi:hypothetical protein